MSNRRVLSIETAHEVGDTCLCFHVQRAARALARHFDEVFRPLGLTNGQFSLMISLNRQSPPVIGQAAEFLGLDRTTLTAALKSLRRRGLVRVVADKTDKRIRRLVVTPAGQALLRKAYPLWRSAHAKIEATLGAHAPDALRMTLRRLRSDR